MFCNLRRKLNEFNSNNIFESINEYLYDSCEKVHFCSLSFHIMFTSGLYFPTVCFICHRPVH